MITGIFNSNQGIVGERAGDFAQAILTLYPTGTALLLALSSGMRSSPANDTTFSWYEDQHQSGRGTCTSGGTTTTVGVDDSSRYIPGQILLVEETGEYMMVTASASNSLTVVRGMSGTTITSITNGMHAQLIGNAHEESSSMPVAVAQQGVPRSGYTQIFRNAWAISGTAKAVVFRTGDKKANSRLQCAQFHAEDQERSMIWGAQHSGFLNGKPFRLTGGIKSQIISYGGVVQAANTGSVAGNLSQNDFGDFARRVFSKNVKGQPNERIVFCGDIGLQTLNQMAAFDGTYQLMEGADALGIRVNTLITPFGTLKLMTHPLMSENPVWQHEMYVLHPGAIRRRILRDTFQENFDGNGNRLQGIDGDQGMLTTEMGVEVGAAPCMGLITNILKGVKST